MVTAVVYLPAAVVAVYVVAAAVFTAVVVA